MWDGHQVAEVGAAHRLPLQHRVTEALRHGVNFAHQLTHLPDDFLPCVSLHMREEQIGPIVVFQEVDAAQFQLPADLRHIAGVEEVADLVDRDGGRGLQRHGSKDVVHPAQVISLEFVHATHIQSVDVDSELVAETEGQQSAASLARHTDQKDVLFLNLRFKRFQCHFQNNGKVSRLGFGHWPAIEFFVLSHSTLGHRKGEGVVLLDLFQDGVLHLDAVLHPYVEGDDVVVQRDADVEIIAKIKVVDPLHAIQQDGGQPVDVFLDHWTGLGMVALAQAAPSCDVNGNVHRLGRFRRNFDARLTQPVGQHQSGLVFRHGLHLGQLAGLGGS